MSVLQSTQDAGIAFLKGRSEFRQARSGYAKRLADAILLEDVADINTEIEAAINKIGLSIMLLTASADVAHPNVRGPYFNNVTTILEAMERPITNRRSSGTGYTALDVVEMCAWYLHNEETIPLYVSGENAIQRVQSPIEGTVTYHLRLIYQDGLKLKAP